MNKSISKVIHALLTLLKGLKFSEISVTDIKEISKNNPNYLLPALKMLFNGIHFLKYNEIDQVVTDELFSKFSVNSICLFLSEELTNFGYLCHDNEIQQPIMCFFGFCYLFESFLIGKIIQKSLFFSDPLMISLKQTHEKDDETPLINDSNIHHCTILKQKINCLLKQIHTLSEIISKREKRLKESTESGNHSGLSVEIIYLLKNPSILNQCKIELKNENYFLNSICEWFEYENQFCEWLINLQSKYSQELSIDNNQYLNLLNTNTIEMNKCQYKLMENEMLASKIDEIWFNLVNDIDSSCIELVSKLNAESFIESCINNLISLPQLNSFNNFSSFHKDSIKSINKKIVEINSKFDGKYREKLIKLTQYTDGLILDGSK